MALATLGAAIKLHHHMLANVFRNQMSFFDTTPIGRILNRFSKDVDVIDNTLPQLLRGWIMCLFSVLIFKSQICSVEQVLVFVLPKKIFFKYMWLSLT